MKITEASVAGQCQTPIIDSHVCTPEPTPDGHIHSEESKCWGWCFLISSQQSDTQRAYEPTKESLLSEPQSLVTCLWRHFPAESEIRHSSETLGSHGIKTSLLSCDTWWVGINVSKELSIANFGVEDSHTWGKWYGYRGVRFRTRAMNKIIRTNRCQGERNKNATYLPSPFASYK
jgi:hypothetical protein